ncbi:MAG TPA: type II toxin-antitoxin system Phd/YefM family antitoxin [Pseudonocardia sp.]|jgi:prevent-host-death family protein|uniref:type II toxin-antitoxin system Phd/YefM family antitoxin n=1 Tax=Pseudonocardia sp. TaxID=60912 RepID=UPI002F3F4194
MEKQVNVYEAKSQLSKLLEQVENGDEIIIARNGKPVARLVPVQRRTSPRVPGAWKGKGWIADDFDNPGGEYEEIIDEFYERLGVDPKVWGTESTDPK